MILIYQYYNSLILTIPLLPPIPMWPNLHHHPPVLSVSAVPGSLEHILAVPKHDCLGTSKDACGLDRGTSLVPFHYWSAMRKWGMYFCLQVFLQFWYPCSSNVSFLLPSVLCLQCQSYVKLSSFSPTLFPEKIPERCASKERLKSLMED